MLNLLVSETEILVLTLCLLTGNTRKHSDGHRLDQITLKYNCLFLMTLPQAPATTSKNLLKIQIHL